jgi:hypothetical protein
MFQGNTSPSFNKFKRYKLSIQTSHLVVHVHLPLCKSFISSRGRPLFINHSGIIEERQFIGSTYMNIKEAEKLVRKHLSDQIRIDYYSEPPVAIYGCNPEDNYLFSFSLFGPPMVGGSNYIAISKTTCELRVLGRLGD